MFKSKLLFYGVAATAMVGWGAGAACAEGKIVIQPKIHTGVEHNTNFWKGDESEVGVNSYYVKPGIVLGYETPKTKADVDISVNAFWYDDQDTPPAGIRDSSDDDYVGFTGVASVTSQVSDRLKLGVDDALVLTRDPASADVASNSVSREKYTINRLTPEMYYGFARKFALGAKYRNTYTDYTEDLGGEDSNEHRGIFDFYYNMNRSSSLYVDYEIWNREYDLASSEYTSNKITLNYAHRFNILSLIVGAGYHIRTFDVDTFDDIDMFSWDIAVQGEDQVESDRKPRYHFMAKVGQGMNDSGAGEEYYIATTANLEAGYLFLGKLGTIAKFSYQNSDYQNDTDNRDDDKVRASALVTYDIFEYLTVGVEGGLENRDSNISGKDYDDQFINVTLNFDYNFGSR